MVEGTAETRVLDQGAALDNTEGLDHVEELLRVSDTAPTGKGEGEDNRPGRWESGGQRTHAACLEQGGGDGGSSARRKLEELPQALVLGATEGGIGRRDAGGVGRTGRDDAASERSNTGDDSDAQRQEMGKRSSSIETKEKAGGDAELTTSIEREEQDAEALIPKDGQPQQHSELDEGQTDDVIQTPAAAATMALPAVAGSDGKQRALPPDRVEAAPETEHG